jgi:non-specific serine/threonine protein kinase
MIGQTLSHFRIDEKLGAGGMGEVYLAEDTNLRRQVAVKVLSKELATDLGARQMIFQEARAASRLSHPNIATVYEVDEVEGVPFIAMEFIRGESLKDMVARGPIQSTKLVEIARQAAAGLQAAHEAGILHRDIKPGNIMLTPASQVKILDFGLAALTNKEREADETQADFFSRTATKWTTGGTVPYMSPEQLGGDASDVRTDIFSFGVLLYECLTGRLPFFGQTPVDIMHAILRQQPTPLRSLMPDVSPAWERLVERCLAKTPEQRPTDMGEVLAGLEQAAETAAAGADKSLAVLYFENLSRDEEDEYFRDGITEDIITELSKIKELTVFSRSAVFAFRDKHVTAPEVGQQLNSSYVLEGSLRRAGKRVRITGRLVETRTGHTVWNERYDRDLEDIFAIQDEIAQAIAQAMQVMLTDQEKEEIQKAPTADIQAYDLYLRGRQYFHQFRRQGYDFARQMFARATVIDPNYARAYAGVAYCCSFLYMYFEASETNLREADAASRKALELAPDLAEAHTSRGLAISLSRRFDEAAEEFEKAIGLDANLFEAHYFYARARVAEGKFDEAVQLFQQAADVNPDDYQAPFFKAQALQGAHREKEADAAYRQALEVIEKYKELHPDDPRALYLGASALSRIGDRERALQWARKALAMDPEDTGVLYNVACNFARLGQLDECLDCLEKALAAQGGSYREWMDNDPALDPVRELPRFQDMMRLFDKEA